jgi:hypothetical protein
VQDQQKSLRAAVISNPDRLLQELISIENMARKLLSEARHYKAKSLDTQGRIDSQLQESADTFGSKLLSGFTLGLLGGGSSGGIISGIFSGAKSLAQMAQVGLLYGSRSLAEDKAKDAKYLVSVPGVELSK